jgi:hypothetical protein
LPDGHRAIGPYAATASATMTLVSFILASDRDERRAQQR